LSAGPRRACFGDLLEDPMCNHAACMVRTSKTDHSDCRLPG
jgi:hypothetical protein